MKHQEQQLRKFGNTYHDHVDLKPGVACELKKHFTSSTITRELAGWIDGMAASNRHHFVFAKPKTMATKCHHWKDGKKNGTAKIRTIEYALDLFEALGLIFYCTILFKGTMRRGFKVINHSHAAVRDKTGCDLHTFGSKYSQHFFPKPGLPKPPRRGGRRDSKWKSITDGPAAAFGAAGAQSGAQSSAQSFSENAKAGAQTKENGCANGCAIEGEQIIEKANDATSDPKFGLQFGGAEPLVKVKREPIKPNKPAGTPPASLPFDQGQTKGKPTPAQLFFQRQAKGKATETANQTQQRKNSRDPKATCAVEFEQLFLAGLSDSAFFSTASDHEFNYVALDTYPQKEALRLACAKVADNMANAQYEGRITNARLMADAMALLKEQGIKAPGGWYPAIKRLRAPHSRVNCDVQGL
jgi:hypothetical protein